MLLSRAMSRRQRVPPVYSSWCTVQCPFQCPLFSVPYQCPLFNVHFSMSTFQCALSMSTFQCTLFNVHFSMCPFQCPLFSVQFSMSTFQCPLFNAVCKDSVCIVCRCVSGKRETDREQFIRIGILSQGVESDRYIEVQGATVDHNWDHN